MQTNYKFVIAQTFKVRPNYIETKYKFIIAQSFKVLPNFKNCSIITFKKNLEADLLLPEKKIRDIF